MGGFLFYSLRFLDAFGVLARVGVDADNVAQTV